MACFGLSVEQCVWWESWLRSTEVSDYTSDEARLLHMFLALYSSSLAFEFALSKR